MSKRRRRTDPRKVTLALCAVMLVVTVGICAAAFMGGNGVSLSEFTAKLDAAFEKSEQSESENPSASSGAENESKPVVELYGEPGEMRAVTLHAGEDIPFSGSEESVRAAVSEALDAVSGMNVMNTVVIETMSADGKLIYPSALQNTEPSDVDPLAIAIEEAKARGFYVYTTYYLTDCMRGESPSVQRMADAALIDAIETDAHGFASRYAPNGVFFDGYYNVTDERAYARYMALGGADGFEDYIDSIASALLRTAHKAFREENAAIRIGIQSEAVWANDYEDERGSATRALFCANTEGNADIFAFIDEGLVDFIAVKAYGSLSDGNTPFSTVAAWWSDVAEENDLPLFIVHAAEKAITDAQGWGEYDQLARQVIDARTLGGYRGSVFNSLRRMRENPSDFAEKLIGYYEGTVLEEHIMQDLELTRPSSTKFTTYDPAVGFAGNTDPNTSATINGVPITVDANGYFQLDMDLVEGENVFNIVHKGKTVTYRINRVTEVVKEISPASGTLTVDGSTKLTITAVAYEEAEVWATINGTTVSLSRTQEQDDEYRDTTYARFSGVYQVPDATTAVQNLGQLVVSGSWNGITKSKTGATVKVNEKLLPSDGQPIVVTSALAETFPGGVVSHYSDPSYFPLPKGTLDYALGDAIDYSVVENGERKMYQFYRLQSGLRVLAEDIAAVSAASAPAGNRITGITVDSDREHTKVILATAQQVSYTAKYSDNAITVEFHYTESVPEGMSLSKNPLFSSVKFSGSKMTLTLAESGRFFGYDAWYDNGGNLVLCFNNPPDVNGDDLDGATIVIDPGHGVEDTGALGFLSSYPEKTINYNIASELRDILEDYGANVVMLPTNKKNYSLDERVKMAAKEDPDLFISVHNNSSATSSSAVGSEAYHFNSWSSLLAKYAARNLADALDTTNRGGKFGYYKVTRTMQYPAILIEGGFVSNRNEYHKLIDEDYQRDMAEGLAEAIVDYFDAMGAGTVVTGKQSKGTSVADAGAGTSTSGGSSDTSSSSGGEELTISETKLTLSVGDEAELWVEWESTEDYEIEWRANSAGEDKVDLDPDNDLLTFTALEAGEVRLTARIKGVSGTEVHCVVTIEE